MDASQKLLGLPYLAWIPLFPLIGAFLNLTIGRRLSRGAVHAIAIGAVVAACVTSFFMVLGPLYKDFKAGTGGVGIFQSVYTWIEVGGFKVELAFRLDTLSAVMIMIVTFVGSLIHIYSTGYMAHEPRYAAYFGYLNLFTGAMLILVLAANMPVMFIGWEGVGLCSFLLIGFWYERDDYAYAGRKAFVVNRIGDFAFLLGMFLLFWATKDMNLPGGSLDFQALESASAQGKYVADYKCAANAIGGPCFWGSERLAAAAGIFLFIGAAGKSAQIPLYVWLPDAMAGPTPVSALIHAATMVTAGVYMICRLSYLYASSTTALAVVAVVGMLTALAAAFMAFAQTDLKKVLAYSTVSQLGFMFVAAGTGNWVAAIFHLGTHAFFKACLFLGAGSVMHGMEHGGSTTPGDITTMGGLRKKMPITRITFMISCLAIAGIAPFAGFFSKDEILGGAWSVHPPGWPPFLGKLLWVGLAIAALGTAFYMWRLYFLVFSGAPRSEAAEHAHESPRSMTGPLVVLAGLATVAGLIGFPHLSDVKLPGFTHGLSTWLAPSVVHQWNDPEQPRPQLLGPPPSATLVVQPIDTLGLAISSIANEIGNTQDCKKAAKTIETRSKDIKLLVAAYDSQRARLVDPAAMAWADESYRQKVDSSTRILFASPCRGLPEFHAALGHFPVQPSNAIAGHPSNTTILLLMVIALAIGAAGIGLAYMLYGKGPTKTVKNAVEGPLAGAYEASKNKLWVDELYDVVIVRPFRWAAMGLYEVVDKWVIDGIAVNGSALVVSLFGRIARWFQNGQVQRYLTGLVIGAAAVFFVTDFNHEPTFDIEDQGEYWLLTAQPGAGVVSATAKLEWDVTGDGVADENPEAPGSILSGPEVRVRKRGDMSTITLIIHDPVTKKTESVSRILPSTVGGGPPVGGTAEEKQ